MNRLFRLILSLCAVCAFTFAADFQKIHFTDDGTATGTPLAPGFTMSSCWGALGYHYNGNVYIAISNHIENSGNVALFRYDTHTGTMHFLNTVKDISTAAGNWLTGDTQYKIHSQLPQHADGTIYMTTQEDGNPLYLGSKMYTIGPDDTSTVTDYTASASWYLDEDMATQSGTPGFLTEKHGVIALGVNPRVPDVTYGITYPDGYLFIHNPQTGSVKKVVKTISGTSDYISRYIGVDNDGNAYIAKNLENETEQVYKFRLSDSSWYAIGDPFPETGSHAIWGGFMAQAATASGETLFARTFDGQTVRVAYATESVEVIGTTMPAASYGDHTIALSADGFRIYSLTSNWTGNTKFTTFMIPTGGNVSTTIPLYAGYDMLKGMHVADTYGNFYTVGWKSSTAAGSDNIALLKVNPGAGQIEPIPPLSVWEGNAINDRRPVTAPPAGLTDAGVFPSPFTTELTIGFRAEGVAAVDIYDPNGRTVRSFTSPGHAVRYRTVTWDGRDRSGREVRNGMYVYRITAGSHRTGGIVFKTR